MTTPILGLSVADSALYAGALGDNCEVRHQVLNLDLAHALVADMAPVWQDAQINIVSGGENGVTRTLQMGFTDPDHQLRLDSSAPTEGVGGMDRLIQIRTFVRGPGWTTWLGAPVFTGRPSVISRDGDTVTVEAQDKACLHLRSVSAFTVHKRDRYVDAIKEILTRGGETRFRFPAGLTKTMPAGRHIGGPDEDRQPWKVAHNLAEDIGYQLYFDVTGYACMRIPPTEYAWEVRELGEGAATLSRVKMSTDLTTIRNRVVATGHTKAHSGHSSKVLTATATLPAAHPLSGQSLAQGGAPWYNTAFYDEPDIHTQSDLDAFAKGRLTDLSTEDVRVETTMPPAYHLEALDKVRLVTANGGAVGVRLKDASIPLGPDETGMTIGYTERVRSAVAGRLRAA